LAACNYGEARMSSSEGEHRLQLKVLVDGLPKEKEYPASLKVEEVIKSLLPEGQKQEWQQYQLVDRGVSLDPLDPLRSLTDDGVKSGDTLSFTRKEGGGGKPARSLARDR
jgi:hypothetical protein